MTTDRFNKCNSEYEAILLLPTTAKSYLDIISEHTAFLGAVSGIWETTDLDINLILYSNNQIITSGLQVSSDSDNLYIYLNKSKFILDTSAFVSYDEENKTTQIFIYGKARFNKKSDYALILLKGILTKYEVFQLLLPSSIEG